MSEKKINNFFNLLILHFDNTFHILMELSIIFTAYNVYVKIF